MQIKSMVLRLGLGVSSAVYHYSLSLPVNATYVNWSSLDKHNIFVCFRYFIVFQSHCRIRYNRFETDGVLYT